MYDQFDQQIYRLKYNLENLLDVFTFQNLDMPLSVLHLIDNDYDVFIAMKNSFEKHPEVIVEHGNIIDSAFDVLVSPANSYGEMDGGVDKVYKKYFGSKIQEKVQSATAQREEEYLPIGASLIVNTSNEKIPYLIVAPTMLMPEAIPSLNCYRAFRAALRVTVQFPKPMHVFCPGMGTGVGMVDPEAASEEMEKAYSDWKSKH